MNRRKMLAALCLLFAVGGIILAEFEAEADSQNVIITFGDGIRQLEGSWENTQYTERESFTHDLLSKAEDHDYVMAEITVEEQQAEFVWNYGDDRDSMVQDYRVRKADCMSRTDKKPADYWFFLKLKVDDVYDIDIWRSVQEVWGATLQDGQSIDAFVNESGQIFIIEEFDDKGYDIGTWQVYFKDDFLYVLECVGHQISSEEQLQKPLHYFYRYSILETADEWCMWGMDEELFYWRDHDSRVTSRENPSRTFTQAAGKDDRWSHYPGKQPCGVTLEAEYVFAPAQTAPELRVCFTLEESLDNLYLPDIGPADYPYTMEVSDAATGEVYQTTSTRMCVDAIDTMKLTDLDGDGFLDMYIVRPDHPTVAESDTDDHFSYTYYSYGTPEQWVWNVQENQFVHMTRAELKKHTSAKQAAQQESQPVQKKPATEPGASVIVPTQEGTVLVQQGDSLWKIAERCLGDGSRYTTIYDRNRALIGDDPRLILPGMELDLGSPE